MTTAGSDIKILERLLGLQVLAGIGDVALIDLAQHSRTESFAAGSVLRAESYAGQRLYLVSGRITLSLDNKVLQQVEAGSDRALLPVFRVRTHGLLGQCQSTVELLSIDEATFDRYAKIAPPENSGIEVSEYMHVKDTSAETRKRKLDFTPAEVDLPSMPETAMRIYKILQDADADIKRVADTIKLDPIIAVRIMQVANSAMYKTAHTAESIKDAILRIGLNATRAVVMSVVLKNLFTPKSRIIHRQLQQFYQHSIRVGAIAYTLAKHLKGFDPDEALLAGLIHDIGVVPILIEADYNEILIEDEAELAGNLKTRIHDVGANLLREWGFEDSFITVAQHSEDWSREVAVADYCDLIQMSQLHCAIIGGKKLSTPAINSIPAFKRLDMDRIDPQSIIKDAKHEIHEIVEMLSIP